jgi:DNA polymerase III epsilon subunit family exonuclease
MALLPSSLEFIALDVETTGLSARTDRIVEIGAVRFDASGRTLDRFEQLVNPKCPMPSRVQAIHGISDADVADAPEASSVLPEFLAFIGDADRTWLIAHNAAFDAGFLGSELRRAGLPSPGHRLVDTLHLARRRRPDLVSHRLDYLAVVLKLDDSRKHRALADSLRVKELWFKLHGPAFPPNELVSYPIHDPREATPPPHGWESLQEAIASVSTLQIVYDGGSRGLTPRTITPRRFLHKCGTAYLVAYCHLDCIEKSFRLERIRSWTPMVAEVETSKSSPC